jgi:tetratricopeptide (TPR) repeat protein
LPCGASTTHHGFGARKGVRRGESRRPRARWVWILLALVACGCASATKRFEQGTELENQGRYADAAQRYIQALRKDPGMVQARQRLIAVAPLHIQQCMEDSERYRALGSDVQGADLYLSIDALVRDAGSVGVPLALPHDYHASQRTAFNDAIDQLMASGEQAEARSRWREAMNTYEQIDAYTPTASQRRVAAEARVRTAISWGEAEFAAGHYRAAAERADLALALLSGAAHPAANRAQNLRQEAITQGTVHVAVAPVARPKNTAHALPPDFTSALNDEMELHHWSQPPLFVAVLDPLVVRRELRFQRLSRRPLGTSEATRVGRNLGADYVVASRIAEFVVTEKNVSFDERIARTRADQDTSYVVVKGRMDYELTIEFSVIDVQRGRVTRDGSCVVGASDEFERGEYDGDPDELKLTSRERRLFDPHWQRESARDAETHLLDGMTDALARRVFDELLACVP